MPDQYGEDEEAGEEGDPDPDIDLAGPQLILKDPESAYEENTCFFTNEHLRRNTNMRI